MSRKKSRKQKKRISPLKVFVCVFFIAMALIIVTALVNDKISGKLYPLKYSNYVEKYAAEYGVPEDLIYATISVESSFDENAVSHAGAVGLTQIMPDTLAWLQTKTGENYTEEDLKNPEISIKYCALFYSVLLEKYGTLDEAICAYHAGINQVAVWLRNPEYSSDGKTLDKIPSRTTAHYLNKVIKTKDIYNNLYEKELNNHG